MEYLKNYSKKVSFFNKVDLDLLPHDELRVLYQDDEHFFTCRKGTLFDVFTMRELSGELVMEVAFYHESKKTTITSETRHLDYQFSFFFESAIKKAEANEEKTLVQDSFFQDAYTRIYHLKKYPEYLDEEEKHLVYVRIPQDILEIKRVYSSLLNDEKQSVEKKMNGIKKLLQHQLEDLMKKVEKRKIDKIEVKFRMYQERAISKDS